MGDEFQVSGTEAEHFRRFSRAVLRDVHALEKLLGEDRLETGERRIGAEQEFFLVDEDWRPAAVNTEILAGMEDPRVVSELGRFNMELNADPLEYGGGCLGEMHRQLHGLLREVDERARDHGARVLLTGILPTLRKSDLQEESMTPRNRYRVLNEALTRARGGKFDFYIRGTDELHIEHRSMMFEAANTSFQVHFQVDPDEFARLYNVSQLITAPVLGVAVNSPLLFARRLWHETRIPLFQQSIDTRKRLPELREIQPRVTFGRRWVEESVLEIYREDIARFRSLISVEIDEDPFERMEEGLAPRLEALQLHNSTIYRWNRPCYGRTNERLGHLRIEFRALPSGPTLLDEIANATFWYGLLSGVTEEYGEIAELMEFDVARGNFIAAARQGIGAQLTWLDEEAWDVADLVRERLLPLAREGLAESGIHDDDAERYLRVISERVRRRRTGARWQLRSLAALDEGGGTPEERMRALTGAMHQRQTSRQPVHEWELARREEGGGWRPSYLRLEGFMNTDLLTVKADEAVELVANLIAWHRVRYVPVEDDDHRLLGLVTDRILLEHLTEEPEQGGGEDRRDGRDEDSVVAVSEIMKCDLVTASPETPTLEALERMRREGIACLPVVRDGRLVGLVTERDFLEVAGRLLETRPDEAR